MEFLRRLSEWSELDWKILAIILTVLFVIWTTSLFFIHVLIVRKNVRIVEAKYRKLVKPLLFGDNNQTIKELNTKSINKENW